ncbi:phosphoribosylanthranilate isomerase [Simulacricoccus sp. 17bor-14]|nr:phosphoribosylanthranilate isomerase [Simulacricoccus sp. 17bor-14]
MSGPTRVRVKVCGVTRLEDAQDAWEAGADALGLNFCARSPRCVSPEAAAALARTRPPFGSVVGVFVDEAPARIRALVAQCGLGAVQLHGEEPPEQCRGYGVPVIKAVRVRGPADVARARAYVGAGDVRALLLDGASPGQGVGFDWALLEPLRGCGLPLLVAGGLTPQNVEAAVRATRPYGVDVASGVERAPGLKDPRAVRAFVRAAQTPFMQEPHP